MEHIDKFKAFTHCSKCGLEVSLDSVITCPLCSASYHPACTKNNYKCSTYGCSEAITKSTNGTDSRKVSGDIICNSIFPLIHSYRLGSAVVLTALTSALLLAYFLLDNPNPNFLNSFLNYLVLVSFASIFTYKLAPYIRRTPVVSAFLLLLLTVLTGLLIANAFPYRFYLFYLVLYLSINFGIAFAISVSTKLLHFDSGNRFFRQYLTIVKALFSSIACCTAYYFTTYYFFPLASFSSIKVIFAVFLLCSICQYPIYEATSISEYLDKDRKAIAQDEDTTNWSTTKKGEK